MVRQQHRSAGASLLVCAGCAVLLQVLTSGLSAFTSSIHKRDATTSTIRRRAAMPEGADMKALESMMNDPEKVEQMQKAMDDIMKDPAKKKAFEDYSAQMQSAVAKLKDDPEMKEFFEDVEKNGMQAMEKWQKDERILRKFSMAAGGPQGIPNLGGMAGMGAPPAGAAAAGPSYKPGDQVIINGLSKAPELNGKSAMVVPPTAEEKKTLEGTDRLIVRLLDSGDQFAVRPANLRTTEQEVNEVLKKDVEDVSILNPALQTEAAKLRQSGKLEDLQNDPELKPVFEDIKKNGMGALEKYWNDEKLMAKISKVMGA